MNKNLYNQIIQLIDDNKIEEAINVFKKWGITNDKLELSSSLTNLRLRYSRVKRQEKSGIIKLNKALPEYAFVIDSTLDFLTSELDRDKEISTNSQKTILFIASMPSDEVELELDKEFVKIYRNLQSEADNYKIRVEAEVKSSDLQKIILGHKPHIIHFVGHGTNSTPIKESGLLLEDKTGRAKLVPTSALISLFKILGQKLDIEIVVLNACYTIELAKGLIDYVPYVVGIKSRIDDEAALEFSNSFYQNLATEEDDVQFAFDLAKNAIQLAGLEGNDLPVLLKK